MVSVIDIEAGRRFIARLGALSPDDWRKLAELAEPLRGESIGAVWRRAELKRPTAVPRGIATAIQTVSAAGALVGEFSPRDKNAIYPLLRKHAAERTDRPPDIRALFIAQADAHDVVVAACPGDEAVHEAVMGALDAVCWSASPVADRVRVASQYRYVEPVIPSDEVLGR